jgi:hypothetical protein
VLSASGMGMKAWTVHLKILSKRESTDIGLDGCEIWDRTIGNANPAVDVWC